MVASRKAFSLVELLIVILILGVLAGLVIIGLGVLGKPAQEKDTRQTLNNLRNTLDELRNKTNLAKFYPANDANWPRPLPAPTAGFYEIGKTPAAWTPDQIKAIGNTRVLMHKIRQVPANKASLNDLPTDRQFKFGNLAGRNDDVGIQDSPVILDAWGTPILLVPAEGLSGVYQGDRKNPQKVTITSIKRRTEAVEPNDPPLPGARPFFVSAGPDGFFAFTDHNKNGIFEPNADPPEGPAGDDNIYSFED